MFGSADPGLLVLATPPLGLNVSLEPYRGAPQTISVLKREVGASSGQLVVRQLAEQVCGGLDSKDYLSEYLALYNFVLARCRYMRDPRAVELVRKPHVICAELLRGGRPNLDCDDESVLLAALFAAVGANVRFVTVAFSDAYYKGMRQYSHVFCQALEPKTGTWIVFDPVAADRTQQMLRRVKAAAIWSV